MNLFTEDAHYTHGSRRSEGRVEIRQLFDQRDQSIRAARHLQSDAFFVMQAFKHDTDFFFGWRLKPDKARTIIDLG